MASKLVLLCALVAVASGASLRDERGILNLAEKALGSAFGKAAAVLGNADAIKEQCNARGYFRQEGRFMEKRGVLNLANSAIWGGLTGLGSIIGTGTNQGACEANGYFKDEGQQDINSRGGEGPYRGGGGGGRGGGGRGGGNGPIYVQGQQAPPPIIVYDPPTTYDVQYGG